MSVRAYKVRLIETEQQPSFNLWHCHDGLLDALNVSYQLNEEGGGYVWVSKCNVVQAIENTKDKQLIKELNEVLQDFSDPCDDQILYNCF